MKIGIIGSDGIPARYGGFETFVEQVAPHLVDLGHEVVVVGSSKGRDPKILSVQRTDGVTATYLPMSANGASSIPYDLFSFLTVWRKVDALLILGVSAGGFMPIIQLLAGQCPVVVNVDGLEARRAKWTGFRKKFLGWSESVAIRYADVVVCDNEGIRDLVCENYSKVRCATIAYGNDHVLRLSEEEVCHLLEKKFSLTPESYALSIARIEPENNVDLMIDAFLASSAANCYVLVGNFSTTEFGRHLKLRHAGDDRIRMIDGLYDPKLLAALRSGCRLYLHGHSVGGTNPSLVEILPYARPVLAFDCIFNRCTMAGSGGYFDDRKSLSNILNRDDFADFVPSEAVRTDCRHSWRGIAEDYVQAFKAGSELN